MTEAGMNYFSVRARSQKGLPLLPPPNSWNPEQIVWLDADFASGGPWAGVSMLVEKAYLWLVEHGATAVLDRHNYELHMALVNHRAHLPLRNWSLTDHAEGAEKTRNFPLDRAYRLVHGLVDLIFEWRRLSDFAGPSLIVVSNLATSQHLATRFFMELARRGGERTRWLLLIAREVPAEVKANRRLSVEHISCVLLAPATGPVPNAFNSEEEAREALTRLTTFDEIERRGNLLLAHYRRCGDLLNAAKVALSLLHACNHYGYYVEASSYIDLVLPHYDELVEGSEANRWNYSGNIFHSLMVQGELDRAMGILATVAEPYLTEKALRARMEYILGIVDLRHRTPPDLEAAERHLCAAVALLASASGHIPAHEHAFLSVFIENGVAFLRVRQGRRREAIELCQAGYALLTRELGEEKHRLHRSVLQYNTAQVYAIMGDFDAALHYYHLAVAMDPNYSEYHNEMGNIYQRLEAYDRALLAYDRAISLSAPYPEVHFNRALCLARREDWQAALASCEYSLDLNPEQPEAWLVHAEICEQVGAWQPALDSYDEALALNDTLTAARVNKAVLLFNQGKFDLALEAMDAVIAQDSQQASHYANRALIHKEMGNRELCSQDERRAEWYGEQAMVGPAA